MFRIGDNVRFDTSHKYNPGYDETHSYTGVLKIKFDEGAWLIGVEGKPDALVNEKHMELIPTCSALNCLDRKFCKKYDSTYEGNMGSVYKAPTPPIGYIEGSEGCPLFFNKNNK